LQAYSHSRVLNLHACTSSFNKAARSHIVQFISLETARGPIKLTLQNGHLYPSPINNSANTRWIPCAPSVGYKLNTTNPVPYRRLALALTVTSQDQVAVVHRYALNELLDQICSGSPLTDTATVLRDLVNCTLLNDAKASPLAVFRAMNAGASLLERFPNALSALEDHWRTRFSRQGDQDEHSTVINDLLKPCAKETILVVSSQKYMSDMVTLLQPDRSPELLVNHVLIEPANFESVIAELEQLSQGKTLVFTLAWLKGLFAPTAFMRFMALFRPMGPLRLVLFNDTQINTLLQMVPTFRSWMYTPPSTALAASFSQVVPYEDLGVAISPCVPLIARSLEASSTVPALSAEQLALEAAVNVAAIDWLKRVSQIIRQSPVVLQSPQECAALVADYLPSVHGAAVEALMQSVETPGFGDWINQILKAKDTETNKIFIIQNAHLLSAPEQRRLLETCQKVILCVPFVAPELREILFGGECKVAFIEARASLQPSGPDKDVWLALQLMLGSLIQQEHTAKYKFPLDGSALKKFSADLAQQSGNAASLEAAERFLIAVNETSNAPGSARGQHQLAGLIYQRCAAYVLAHQDGLAGALTFEDYCLRVPLAQLQSQAARVLSWLALLQDDMDAQLAPMLKSEAHNVHSNTLLTLFEPAATRQSLASFVNTTNSGMADQDFFQMQLKIPAELSWKSLLQSQSASSVFPYSRQHLLRALRSYAHPIKLVSFVAPTTLFSYLEQLDHLSMRALEKLCQHLADPAVFRRLTPEMSPAFAKHLAVIRWCLNCQSLTESLSLTKEQRDALALTSEDVKLIFTLNVHLSDIQRIAAMVIPVTLAMDGSATLISTQSVLRDFLFSCDNASEQFLLSTTPTPSRGATRPANSSGSRSIGSAFVEFIMLEESRKKTTESLQRSKTALLAHPFVEGLQFLLGLPVSNAKSMATAIQDFLTHVNSTFGSLDSSLQDTSFAASFVRLTPAALVLLVTRCTNTAQARMLACLVGELLASDFLDTVESVIRTLPSSAAFRLRFLSALIEHDKISEASLRQLASASSFQDGMIEAVLKVHSEPNSFVAVFFSPESTVQYCPIDEFPFLKDLFLDNFTDGSGALAEANRTATANLISRSLTSQTFKRLARDSFDAENSWLEVIVWCNYPLSNRDLTVEQLSWSGS
jgi:hypothetical protein